MANEYTLADYEAIAQDNLTKGLVRTWREASPVMDMLSITEDPKLSNKILRYNSLPTTHWRKVSETFQDVKVEPDSVEERLFFFGDKIDVPYEYVKAPQLTNTRADQEEAVMKAQAFMFNEAFFTNTPSADEDAPVGLHYRLINDFAAAQSVDGGGLDISSDTAVTNWQHKLFDLIEDLLSQVDGEDSQKVLFMNKTVKMRTHSALRSANQLFTDKDAIRSYATIGQGGPKLVDIGYKTNQSDFVMPNTELANGTALTGATFSSITCVRFGSPFLAGWSQERPFAEDVGLIEARTHYRTVVRGSIGIYIAHPRAIARLYNLQAA